MDLRQEVLPAAARLKLPEVDLQGGRLLLLDRCLAALPAAAFLGGCGVGVVRFLK